MPPDVAKYPRGGESGRWGWQPGDKDDCPGGVRSDQIQNLLGVTRGRWVTADSRVLAELLEGWNCHWLRWGRQQNEFEDRAVWSPHERSGLEWSTCFAHCLYNGRIGRKELIVKVKGSEDVGVIDFFLGGQAFSGLRLRVTRLLSHEG